MSEHFLPVWKRESFGLIGIFFKTCKTCSGHHRDIKTGSDRSGSSVSSPSYCSRSDLARKKMIPAATIRKPATEAMAMPTTSGSETYSSQCSPRYHQFSPTRHLRQRSQVQFPKTLTCHFEKSWKKNFNVDLYVSVYSSSAF